MNEVLEHYLLELLVTHPSHDPITSHLEAVCGAWHGVGGGDGALKGKRPLKQWTGALEHSARLPDVFLFSCPPSCC